MVLWLSLTIFWLIAVTAQEKASKCDPGICQIPDCHCGGPKVPGGLSKKEIPQLVLLTFDDAVNEQNNQFYAKLFTSNRTNPNGCPIKATFYVSHEWTDYTMVHDLYRAGHEIASHTITHSDGSWFDEGRWASEVFGQAEILTRFAGVDPNDIKGMRAPFLAIGGDKMFGALNKNGFTYDSSMPLWSVSGNYGRKDTVPSWPYTLDYAMHHSCTIKPCPQESHPGMWEIPMTVLQDEFGNRCSMSDACTYPEDAEGIKRVFVRNFLNFYTRSKAPFPIFTHAAWYSNNQARVDGFLAFVDEILRLPDVYFVTSQEVIDFTKYPQTLKAIANNEKFGCRSVVAKRARQGQCARTTCHPWHHWGAKRRLTSCARDCTHLYPWLGNYKGEKTGEE